MKICAAAACAAMLMSGLASPARADMSHAFGNTVVSHYPDGGWVKHFFEPDGRYSAVWSDGRKINARWRQDGERVCLNEIRPRMIIGRFCTAMVTAGVGSTWRSRDPIGRTVRNVLVAGR
ncbi:hypothetical protein KY493_06010 [Brevundimonas sp. PAMC22021]|nr:hypothetical protein KY493_06010 [Brevundimonas sp. PAMC22021]